MLLLNNHFGDFGLEGIKLTKKTLSEPGVQYLEQTIGLALRLVIVLSIAGLIWIQTHPNHSKFSIACH